MRKYDIIVIGGGASGIVAAIAAKQHNPRKSVLIIESLNKLGKKILVSGNGRCNILNSGDYAYFGDSNFAKKVLGDNAFQEMKDFFHALGLSIVIESENRAYPASFQAETVMETLQLAINRLGIDVLLESEVQAFFKKNDYFEVQLNADKVIAKKIIVAVGGVASPKHGSTGNLYPILKKIGYHIIDPRPSLCPILTETKDIKNLSGVRVRANLNIDNVYSTSGEVLFADYGITGIASMQLARFCKTNSIIHMDLRPACGLPDFTRESIISLLWDRVKSYPSDKIQVLLTGLFSTKMSQALRTKAKFSKTYEYCKEIRWQDISTLADIIMDFQLRVVGVKGFAHSQVSTGGIACEQIDSNTMESAINGIYFAGEVLNVDGDCGGYNLMFAFKSGWIAGKNAAE